MRILPVFLGINNLNNKDGCKRLTPANYPRMKTSFIQDTVTFGGGITTPNGLKELAKNGHLRCIWCGGAMFHSSELEKVIFASKKYTKDCSEFVAYMENYKEYFSPEVNNLLKQISAYSQVYPKQSLADIIHKMLPDAENKLVQKQQFIFHKLNKLKSLLPSETQKEFDILLDSSKKRILKIPYTSEYSAKEFYYQLTGLTKNSDNKKVKKLPVLANMLNHPIFKEEPGPAPAKFLEKFYKNAGINPNLKGNYISPRDTDWRTKLKVLVINEIERIAQGAGRSDIERLCKLTRNKALGKPSVVPFSNKAFVYKMNEVLSGIKDKELIKQFNAIASQLPTSVDNMNAFVVKYKNSPEGVLIEKLLSMFLVTTEHIVPFLRKTSAGELKHRLNDRKGVNKLENWSLAHFCCNNLHGSKNIKGENFPFSKEAGIQYFQTLIKDANEGRLLGSSVIQMAKNYFLETGIKINLKGLKYTSEY